MNQHHSSAHPYPPGKVVSSCLLYGAVGLALALAMHLLGMFEQGDIGLKQSLSGLTSDLFLVVVSDSLLFAVAALFSFGIAFAVLDSPAPWRRVLLGVTALVVLLAMVPVCALWQIYFSPFLVVIACFWAWFCAMMYASQHTMPCDSNDSACAQHASVPVEMEPVKAISSNPKLLSEHAHEDKHEDLPSALVADDLDNKYKPKE